MLKNLLSDEQDPVAVERAVQRVTQILTESETIQYVALQKKLVDFAPDCAVLTNKRFIVYRPTLLGGANFQDYPWMELFNATLSEGMLRATISFKTVSGETVQLTDLPKAQARRVYAYAQQMEEYALQWRRQYDLEQRRASAGSVAVTNAAPAAPALLSENPSRAQPAESMSPTQRLQSLVELKNAELISQAEFDQKRAAILGEL